MRPIVEFIFPYRLHRLAYFLRGGLFTLLECILYSINDSIDMRCFWGSVIAITVYGIFFITLPRCRDIQMGGWCILLCFIPIVNIPLGLILLFRAPAYLHREQVIS
jgi:uncharacterized membrane protein YhaH (DUF805 family)